MVSSAREYWVGFQQCLRIYNTDKENCTPLPADVYEILNSPTEDLKCILKYLVLVLKPIGDAIADLERKDAAIGDVWGNLLALHNIFLNQSEDTFPAKYQSLIGLKK